jgi:tetratricopeptide (TPR) repeat protein
MRLSRIPLALLAMALLAAPLPALAQDWKGMGRIEGRVLDPDGKPIADAKVKLSLPERGGATTVTTDKKGHWALGGVASGNWTIDIEATGYAPRALSVNLASESARLPPVEAKLDRAGPKGPPPEVMAALSKGDESYKAGRWAEARAEYERVQQTLQNPTPETLRELRLQIARCYKQEGNYAKEVEVLQQVLDAEPSNTEVKALMAMEAIEGGMLDRGLELLKGVEGSIKSADVFYNIGVTFRNKNKPQEAIDYFTKAVTLDPSYADGYFQRALTYFGVQKMAEAKADFKKVIELSPNSPQAQTAKQALDSMK